MSIWRRHPEVDGMSATMHKPGQSAPPARTHQASRPRQKHEYPYSPAPGATRKYTQDPTANFGNGSPGPPPFKSVTLKRPHPLSSYNSMKADPPKTGVSLVSTQRTLPSTDETKP